MARDASIKNLKSARRAKNDEFYTQYVDIQKEIERYLQRITSLGRFLTDKFAIKDENDLEQYFGGLAQDKKDKILQTKLLIYECRGTESQIKEWFKTINIAGVPLVPQELLNAVYSGSFVTLGREEFSNGQNSNIQKWSAYIKGSVNRQAFLERALVSVPRVLESDESFVILCRRSDSSGGRRCGRKRTEAAMTAAGCVIPAI